MMEGMDSPRLRMGVALAIAVGASALVGLFWGSLERSLGLGAEGMILFVFIILAAAWWGGLWPGLVATAWGSSPRRTTFRAPTRSGPGST